MAQTDQTLPQEVRTWTVTQLSSNFTKAAQLQAQPTSSVLASLRSNQVAVRHHYWAINASDINFTAGRYDATVKPPFDAGFEALGEIVAVGTAVKRWKVGQPVVSMSYGAFAELQVLDERGGLIPVDSLRPDVLSLTVSGLTAYLALKYQGHMTKNETILVTAAAGGAGQMAVALAKAAGNTVIGTTSSEVKAEALRQIGCDRVINYKTEDVNAVLQKEYPKGIDIIFESIGGEMLQTCVKNLAVKGRLLVIGGITNYTAENKVPGKASSALGDDAVRTMMLLGKSCTVAGFLLNNFSSEIPIALADLVQMLKKGTIKPNIEMGDFNGIADIPRALDYLHAGQNLGKLIVPAQRNANNKL